VKIKIVKIHWVFIGNSGWARKVHRGKKYTTGTRSLWLISDLDCTRIIYNKYY
jgi:hypothetical protein